MLISAPVSDHGAGEPQDQLRPDDDKYQTDHVENHERDGPDDDVGKSNSRRSDRFHWAGRCKPPRFVTVRDTYPGWAMKSIP